MLKLYKLLFLLLPEVCRPAVERTRPPIRPVAGGTSPPNTTRGDAKLSTHIILVPRLRVCRAVPFFSHLSSCSAQGYIYFYFLSYQYLLSGKQT